MKKDPRVYFAHILECVQPEVWRVRIGKTRSE